MKKSSKNNIIIIDIEDEDFIKDVNTKDVNKAPKMVESEAKGECSKEDLFKIRKANVSPVKVVDEELPDDKLPDEKHPEELLSEEDLEEIKSGLCKGINEILDDLVQRIELSEHEIKTMKALCGDIKQVLASEFPEVTIEPYGSLSSGLGVRGCDLDLCVSLGQSLQDELSMSGLGCGARPQPLGESPSCFSKTILRDSAGLGPSLGLTLP